VNCVILRLRDWAIVMLLLAFGLWLKPKAAHIIFLTRMRGGLILLHESNTQGGSLGGVLVCAGSPQLCGYASLASPCGVLTTVSSSLGDDCGQCASSFLCLK
jgi:hypothetical protein